MKISNSGSRHWLAIAAAVSALACSSSPFPEGALTLYTGQERDAWDADPPAHTVHVDILQDGVRTPLMDVAAPRAGGEDPPVVSLGRDGPDGVQVSFEATAFDEAGNPVLRGRSTPFTAHRFENTRFFLFLGRPGFARAFGTLHVEHHHPLLTAWPNAYLFVSGSDTAGADGKQLDIYNAALGSLLENEPVLPIVAKSSASTEGKLLLITDAGALWLDLANGETANAIPPSGIDFAEVVNGSTFVAADKTQYVVGATRPTGPATDKVLRVDRDGSLHALKLTAARSGAAAGLVDGRLLVAGGSAKGAGAELFEEGSTSATALDLPADARTGAALAELSASQVVLVGGKDPTTDEVSGLRGLDLECTADCAETELGLVEFELDRLQAFPVSENRVLVVGETSAGETRAYSLDFSDDSPVSVEQPFRERRAGASAALLANGQVAVVGGLEPVTGTPITSLELFFP